MNFVFTTLIFISSLFYNLTSIANSTCSETLAANELSQEALNDLTDFSRSWGVQLLRVNKENDPSFLSDLLESAQAGVFSMFLKMVNTFSSAFESWLHKRELTRSRFKA